MSNHSVGRLAASADKPTPMDQLTETTPEPETTDTLPWWLSNLNLGVVCVAIAILCGALGWVVGNNRAIPDPRSATAIVEGQTSETNEMHKLISG